MKGDVSRLHQMAALKRAEVAAAQSAVPLPSMRRRAQAASPARDFLGALRGPGLALIAEIKLASPAAGRIAEHLDVAALARRYVAGGAQALAVWTDERFFSGSLELLALMRRAAPVPILRKDLIVDPYQVYESRAADADAVLLIAAVLDPPELRRLLRTSRDLGMTAAASVHREVDVDRAVEAGAPAVLIHNRDVGTFEVDLDTTIRLRRRIPPGVVVVSESGIGTPEDVRRLAPHVDAVLVGGALMTADDPEGAIASLLAAGGRARKE